MGQNCSCNPMNAFMNEDPRSRKQYFNTDPGSPIMEDEQHLISKHKKRKKKNDTQTINAGMLTGLESTLKNVGPLMPHQKGKNTNYKPHITDDEVLPPIPPNESQTSSFPNAYNGQEYYQNMVPASSYATDSPAHTASGINPINTQFVYPTQLPSQHSVNSQYSGHNGNPMNPMNPMPIIQQQNVYHQTVMTPNNAMTPVTHVMSANNDPHNLNRRYSTGNPVPSEVSFVQSQHSHRSTIKQQMQQYDSSQNMLQYKLVSMTQQQKSSKNVVLDPGFDPKKHDITVDPFDDHDDVDDNSSDLSNEDDIKELQKATTEREMKKHLDFLKAKNSVHNNKSDIDRTDNDDDNDIDDDDDDESSDEIDNNELEQKQNKREVFRIKSTAQWKTSDVNKLHNDMELQLSNLLAQEQRKSQQLFTRGNYIVNTNPNYNQYDQSNFMMIQEMPSNSNHNPYNTQIPTENLKMIDEVQSVNHQ